MDVCWWVRDHEGSLCDEAFNPFTDPACKISGLNDADVPANSIFSGPITSVFNGMHFDGEPCTCQCKKEEKGAYGFQIWHLMGHFQMTWQ